MRANIGQGTVRPRVGIFRDRKAQATADAAAEGDGDDVEEYEDVWREMTEEDLASLSPEELKSRKLQLGGQGAEAPPLSVRACFGFGFAWCLYAWLDGLMTIGRASALDAAAQLHLYPFLSTVTYAGD